MRPPASPPRFRAAAPAALRRAARHSWCALAACRWRVHLAFSLWPATLPPRPTTRRCSDDHRDAAAAAAGRLPRASASSAQAASARRLAGAPCRADRARRATCARAADRTDRRRHRRGGRRRRQPAPPDVAEPVDSPPPAPSCRQGAAARVDLAYKVFLGTQGFLIGDATYRFEHAGNRYRIYTVGKARGLAALLIRGAGQARKPRAHHAAGLQPLRILVRARRHAIGARSRRSTGRRASSR